MIQIKPNDKLDKKKIFIMNIVLEERSKGKSREECAKIANIKNQRIQNWYTEGKHGFGKENILFYRHLNAIEDDILTKKYSKDIKEYNNPTNAQKRRKYINNIKKGQTRVEASKNANIDLRLPGKWYALGKNGIKPFTGFLSAYQKAKKHAAEIKKNDSKILQPLPEKWQRYFENKPMNQTGIAWVNKVGNNYIYQNQSSKKHIKISDPDIYELYKKVISENHIWGIRDIDKARKIIKKTPAQENDKVTVKYQRSGKNNVKIEINGLVKNSEVKEIFNKLQFFNIDIEERYEKRINGQTQIQIKYNINISLLNTFENTIKEFKWDIIK